MEGLARRPEPLSDKGSMDKNWLSWKQDFLIFMKASGYMNESKERKAYMLMNLVGKVGMEALGNMIFESDEEKEDMHILLIKFDEYFNPPKKETEERYTFFTRSKKCNESIESYIEELKNLAKTCNFGDLTDSLIRDRVIIDIKDKILRKKLLNEKNLDLEKVVMIYQSHEMDTEKMKEMYKSRANSESSVSATQSSSSMTSSCPPKNKGCWRCGKTHEKGKCPAWGKKCSTCNESGHYAHMCQTKKNQAGPFSQINKSVKVQNDNVEEAFFRNMLEKKKLQK